MSTVNNVISNVMATIWAVIALSEWILTEKRFAREWTKACGRIRGNR